MLLAIFMSVVLLLISVSLHYIALSHVSALIQKWRCPGYPGLMMAIAAITSVHVVEAALFAGAFWLGDDVLRLGSFDIGEPMSWMDYFYFSLVNFTTLGRGDIAPSGHLRLIAGLEAFAGFLLITASGAFILQIMAGKAPFARN